MAVHNKLVYGQELHCPNCHRKWDLDDAPPDDELCDGVVRDTSLSTTTKRRNSGPRQHPTRLTHSKANHRKRA